jgi:hypothetical protein
MNNSTTSNHTNPINMGNLNNGTTWNSYVSTSGTIANHIDYSYGYENSINNVDNIILNDEKDGTQWKLKVSDGELVIEPLDKVNIRKLKIKKVLGSE